MSSVALSLSLSLSLSLPLYQGIIEFNLTAIPRAAKSHVECQLPEPDDHVELNNLFEKKRMKGWWPVYKMEENGEKAPKVRYILYSSSSATNLGVTISQ